MVTRAVVVFLAIFLAFVPFEASAQDPRRTPIVVAVERATPAVVTVRVEVQASSPFLQFGADVRASEGSGVVIDADGIVLTNAHVVDGASAIRVHLHDDRTFSADVLAQDPALDLAVLRLHDAHGLPTIPLGDSGHLLLGEPAIAIGNPFGLGLTVSTGVVASTGRDVNVGRGPMQTYIQTDAAINPGNSGGALINIKGELIGINTFIHSSAEGIGFAIPVDRARKIASDLIAYGEVQIPWLGCSLLDVPRHRMGGELAEGALLVRRVFPGSPAAAAGLVPGDFLLALDGHTVLTRADLNARLAERRPGDAVTVAFVREGERLSTSVPTARAPTGLGATALQNAVGIRVTPVRGGLQVTEVGPGSWAEAGLRSGDFILGVEGVRTRSVQELVSLLGRAIARHRASAWFTVARPPHQGTVEVGL